VAQEIDQETGFSLSSPDFEPGDQVPTRLTCAGGTEIPSLKWQNTPADAEELVVALIDYTDFNEPLLLWLAAGIDPKSNKINPETYQDLESIVETKNDWGNIGFGSPCLESIESDDPDTIRDLQFRVYALATKSNIQPAAHGNDSWAEVKAKATHSAAILMRYDANFDNQLEEFDQIPEEIIEE